MSMIGFGLFQQSLMKLIGSDKRTAARLAR